MNNMTVAYITAKQRPKREEYHTFSCSVVIHASKAEK
jgi:hypothetical protein